MTFPAINSFFLCFSWPHPLTSGDPSQQLPVQQFGGRSRGAVSDWHSTRPHCELHIPLTFYFQQVPDWYPPWHLTHPLSYFQTIAPSCSMRKYELLHRITGEGLGVEYCFSRQPFSPDPNMVAVQIQFTNNTSSETKNLHIEEPKLQSGMRIKEFTEIGQSKKT